MLNVYSRYFPSWDFKDLKSSLTGSWGFPRGTRIQNHNWRNDKHPPTPTFLNDPALVEATRSSLYRKANNAEPQLYCPAVSQSARSGNISKWTTPWPLFEKIKPSKILNVYALAYLWITAGDAFVGNELKWFISHRWVTCGACSCMPFFNLMGGDTPSSSWTFMLPRLMSPITAFPDRQSKYHSYIVQCRCHFPKREMEGICFWTPSIN